MKVLKWDCGPIRNVSLDRLTAYVPYDHGNGKLDAGYVSPPVSHVEDGSPEYALGVPR